MKRRLHSKLTYANVMATIAAFMALGGISYAAVEIPKNSVGTEQLKKNSVNSAKIANGSLRIGDFKKAQRARLRGPAGPAGVTGPAGEPATRVWASAEAGASPSILHGDGVTAVAGGYTPGSVDVTFDRDVGQCSFQATPVGHGGGYLTPTVTIGITTGFYKGSGLTSQQIRVTTYYEDAPAARDFDVAAFC